MRCAWTSPISMKTSSRSVCNTSILRSDFILCSMYNFKLSSAEHNLRQGMYLISLFPIPLVSILYSILSRFPHMWLLILILTNHIFKLIHGLIYFSVVTLNLTSPCLHTITVSYWMICILIYQLFSILTKKSLDSSANHFFLTVLSMILKNLTRNEKRGVNRGKIFWDISS